jgi:hypothetical protein
MIVCRTHGQDPPRPCARLATVALAVFLLVAGVRSLLASLGEDSAFVGGPHALDGLVVLGLAGYLQALRSGLSGLSRP